MQQCCLIARKRIGSSFRVRRALEFLQKKEKESMGGSAFGLRESLEGMGWVHLLHPDLEGITFSLAFSLLAPLRLGQSLLKVHVFQSISPFLHCLRSSLLSPTSYILVRNLLSFFFFFTFRLEFYGNIVRVNQLIRSFVCCFLVLHLVISVRG